MYIANDILIPELTRLLNEEKEVRFTPAGTSMRPFIEGGRDSVVLAPLTREPKRGDIVLARALMPDGRMSYVLHRIIRITLHSQLSSSNYTYILQGDGNLEGEESCRREDIIGRVIAVERPSGTRHSSIRPSRMAGLIWYHLRPWRPFLLKLYRKCVL